MPIYAPKVVLKTVSGRIAILSMYSEGMLSVDKNNYIDA